MAIIVHRRGSFGPGCLGQALGGICLVVGLIGVLTVILPLILWPLGIYLLHVGRKASRWLECSDCGTHLSRPGLICCPGCGREFADAKRHKPL